MKKIMYAGLNETLTENEYAWIESTEAEFGREWDGDVEGYLENSDIDLDEYRMVRGGHIIHNLPEEAIILEKDGKPVEIWWAEEI